MRRHAHDHHLAYLAKRLIQSGANDYCAAALTFGEYAQCANLYITAQGAEIGESLDPEEWDRFFLRTAFQQFPLQGNPYPQFARALSLYADIAARPELRRAFDIPATFERLTGLSVEAFVEAATFVFLPIWLQGVRLFHGALLATAGPAASLPLPQMRRFIDHVAVDYDTFRTLCGRTDNPDPTLRAYYPNPLVRHPLVRTQRGQYVAPVPRYLLQRFTTGIYFDLLEAEHEAFTRAFGAIFQQYLGALLASVFGPRQLHAARKYRAGKNWDDSTDWIVVEGESAVLLECKVTRLRLATKATADRDALARDLAQGVVKGLLQLRRVMQAIRERCPGLEAFASVTELIPVVLLYEPYYFANAPVMRTLVEQELRARGVEPFDYQVMDVEALEMALPVLGERGFAALLREKMAARDDPRHSPAFVDFGAYLRALEPGRRWQFPAFLTARSAAFVEGVAERVRARGGVAR